MSVLGLPGSGAPASWVAYHRHHHSRTDTPKDISSPKQGGFWWAHMRWLYQSAPADARRWCPELTRGAYRMWTLVEAPVILLSLLCGLVLGWQGFLWIGAIRLVYSLHMQCFVNSLTHLGHSEEGDSSQNVWWLGPLQNNYHEVVIQLFDEVDPARVAWISLGAFRFMPELKPIIRERHPRSRIVYGEFIRGLDGKMRYFRDIRVALYRVLPDAIRRRAPDVCLYLCMESEDIWRSALGFSPEEQGGLAAMLDDAVRRRMGVGA